jgi:carbon-monoxide dehydrogenase medium subunit
LHEPELSTEALSLLSEYGDEAKVLAGGQSLVPILALRLARFGHLVDLNRVEGLAGIGRVNGDLRVGAMTRHSSVETSDEVLRSVPLLARATAKVGHFQIRNRGTLGGSVAHADPAAEQPAVCLALDAVMEVSSSAGSRDIPAASFFEGTWATTMEADELLMSMRFPVWAGRSGFAVEELARRSGDFALVGVVCGIVLGPDSVPQRAGVALFGVGSTPVRAHAAESAILAGAPTADAGAAASAEIDPGDDLHATGAYRKKVASVLVARAVEAAIKEAESA